MRKLLWICAVLLLASAVCSAQEEKPLLLQQPTVNRTHIVFAYAGDLWSVPREGGLARRLTTSEGTETAPHFSPDGKWIAFSGQYDGNTDVYAIPAEGGEPRRLTFHPSADVVVGWTPDGKSVIFRSNRNSYSGFDRLFTVPVEGGFPNEIPLPEGEEGSYSPDGQQIAYVPNSQWQKESFKKYRGGQTTPIWIARLSDSTIQKVPRENSNDSNPMWIGDKVYFLSDRDGPITLFRYDTATKKVTEALAASGLDIKSASAGPDAIAYGQFGGIYLFDPASGKSSRVNVKIEGDFSWARPHYKNVSKQIAAADISPTGARAVFEAHGEILTAPAEKGDIRDITGTPGVEERNPAWSPDGKWIAYFSDESGEYALHLRNQNGMGETKKIDLGNPPSFFYDPIWSPDGKKIAYSDKRLNLWYVDVEAGKPIKIDTDTYDSPERSLDPSWSPDSRWIAYTKQLQSHYHAVDVYDVQSGKSTQLTDGMSDARYAVFDKGGKYLFFTASTNLALAAAWLDMSSIDRPVTRSAYVTVLRKDLPSPLAPESDDEKASDAAKGPMHGAADAQSQTGDAEKPAGGEAAKSKEAPTVTIDFDGISQRILSLPTPQRNYTGLFAGKAGILFLVEGTPVGLPVQGPPSNTVTKFDLSTRKSEPFLSGISNIAISANGEKALFEQHQQWFITETKAAPKPGEGALHLDGMQVLVDPHAEWKQMYHETWRIERDFLYDPNLHGLDVKAAETFYAKYLDGIEHRADFTYLLDEMLGNITVGHMFVRGGDLPEIPHIPVGLLGADYKIENGRYRFARVYNGENWNPQLHAPLTQPGVNVTAGEYLLAVNGHEVRGTDNIFSFFQNAADKQIVLKVGPNPDGNGAREVTVVPVANELSLRNLAWIEGNRRKVDELSNGKLAYVYLPNTAGGGYNNFNRYYFAQVGKQGAVIDERFNTGGDLSDYIIDYLRRPAMSRVATREGEDWTSPSAAIYGPKAMIINEMAGSGGDALPWYFRKAGIGTLVGKRTWGGLVGIYGYPTLMDGGTITAPRAAIYGLTGDWEVENRGIPPDIDVDFDPAAWRQGHDAQLEKAVSVLLEDLQKHPLPQYKKPSYPNYHQKFSQAPAGH